MNYDYCTIVLHVSYFLFGTRTCISNLIQLRFFHQTVFNLVIYFVHDYHNCTWFCGIKFGVHSRPRCTLKLRNKTEGGGVRQSSRAEPVFVNILRNPGFDSQPVRPVPYLSYRPARLHRVAKSIPRNRILGSLFVYKYGLCAGIFKQSKEVRNRVGIVLSYRPARLHSLAELILWNWFLSSLKV